MPVIHEVCVGAGSLVPAGEGRAFEVGGRRVAVFRTAGNTLFATQDRCPHAGASLAGGIVGAANVICPLHGWKFSLSTGALSHDPGCRLRTYRVREADGLIYVCL